MKFYWGKEKYLKDKKGSVLLTDCFPITLFGDLRSRQNGWKTLSSHASIATLDKSLPDIETILGNMVINVLPSYRYKKEILLAYKCLE